MELRELESFIAIVESGSVSRAAASLGLSQPAVSKHLAHLEDELGVELLLRGRTRSVPTVEGEILLLRGRKILAELQGAADEIRQSGEALSGTVTVAAGSIPGEFILPPLLRRFHERHRGLAIVLEDLDSRRALEALVGRRVDVACLGEDRLPAGYVVRPFVVDELVLACGSGRPFSERASISLEAARDLPLLGRLDGSASQAIWEAALRRKGLVPPDPRLRFKGTGALLRALRGGSVFAVVSRWAVVGETIDFLPFDPPLTRPFFVAHGQSLSRAAQALVGDLLEAKEGFPCSDR